MLELVFKRNLCLTHIKNNIVKNADNARPFAGHLVNCCRCFRYCPWPVLSSSDLCKMSIRSATDVQSYPDWYG